MRITSLLILLSCLLSAPFIRQDVPADDAMPPLDLSLASLRFQTVSLEQGLSQSVVLDIAQDQRGFLWFATEDGLNCYNGYEFTVYRHSADDVGSLANNYVRALHVDQHNTLWIGTDSGLDRFTPDTGTFHHYVEEPDDLQSLAGKEVHAIAEGPDGYLWVGTADGGLSSLDPATGRFRRYPHAGDSPQRLTGTRVNALHWDVQGRLWIGTEQGLDRLDPATGIITHFTPNPVGSSSVGAIHVDRTGEVWVGLEGDGLIRAPHTMASVVHFTHQPDDPHSLSDDSVLTLLEDRGGRLWVGTQHGLNLWDPERERFLRYDHDPTDTHSLAGDAIRSLHEDAGGNLWIGTFGAGLSKLTRTAQDFALYRHDPTVGNSLSGNGIWTVSTTADRSVWVGTMGEGLNRLDRQTGVVDRYQHDINNPQSLSHNDVRVLLTDHNDQIWIGTYGGGLDRFDPRTRSFIHYRHDPTDPFSLGEDQIRVLHEDRAGNIWIATQSQGLDRFDPSTETFVHYRHDAADAGGLSSDRVRAIAEDQQGVLWLGTWNAGIDVLDPETGVVTHYQHEPDDPHSLNHDTVLALHLSKDDVMWVGTYGGGLARFDSATSTFHRYTVADGLPNDGIYGILETPEGTLWISTNNGLSRFDPTSAEMQVGDSAPFRNYGVADGLQSREFNYGAAHQSAWGEFFFGGVEGLNAFYAARLQADPYMPPVVITALRKQNQTLYTNLHPNTQIDLSYKDTSVSFDFAALDYAAPEHQIYRYKMEGQDAGWIEAGTRRHADYTNLRGGTYVFRVIAANSDGGWTTEGTSVQLNVEPPLWETWGFRAGAFLLLLGSVFGGYRWRVRRIEVRSRELEDLVTDRTNELEQRRRVAESLRDILRLLNTESSLEEILQTIVSQACEIGEADAGLIYRYDQTTMSCSAVAIAGMPPDLEPPGPFRLTEIPTQRAVIQSKLHGLSDFDTSRPSGASSDDPTLTRWLDLVSTNFETKLVAPILVLDKFYGALELYYRTPQAFSEDAVTMATTIGTQAALAIENARLRTEAELAGVSSERNRIARELHDSVSQALYGIALGARTARTLVDRQPVDDTVKTTLANPLDYVLSLADAGLAEMRALIFELRPDALEKEGLVAALAKQVGAVRARHQLIVDTDYCPEPELPQAVKEAFYRISQEAMNNLIKHAQASRVRLSLQFTESRLTLEIQDNGVGFDPRQTYPGHLGLHTMQERAARLGGTLEIESAPGKGTLVRASAPIGR